mmetsp:Transcript_25266/g.84929  ORF Transcript_25266/g.84929 Transcript_25266/m.84929 type:complete len:333 (+) Transcript_25266:273-1271(+)
MLRRARVFAGVHRKSSAQGRACALHPPAALPARGRLRGPGRDAAVSPRHRNAIPPPPLPIPPRPRQSRPAPSKRGRRAEGAAGGGIVSPGGAARRLRAISTQKKHRFKRRRLRQPARLLRLGRQNALVGTRARDAPQVRGGIRIQDRGQCQRRHVRRGQTVAGRRRRAKRQHRERPRAGRQLGRPLESTTGASRSPAALRAVVFFFIGQRVGAVFVFVFGRRFSGSGEAGTRGARGSGGGGRSRSRREAPRRIGGGRRCSAEGPKGAARARRLGANGTSMLASEAKIDGQRRGAVSIPSAGARKEGTGAEAAERGRKARGIEARQRRTRRRR